MTDTPRGRLFLFIRIPSRRYPPATGQGRGQPQEPGSRYANSCALTSRRFHVPHPRPRPRSKVTLIDPGPAMQPYRPACLPWSAPATPSLPESRSC